MRNCNCKDPNSLTIMLKPIITLLFSLLFLLPTENHAQQDNSALIYGSIFTDAGEEYTGFIRWGKEEMYWFDVFNAEKNDQYKAPVKEKRPSNWNDIDWSLEGIWKDKYCNSCNVNHAFACMFGEIKKIEILRGDRAELTFKNGSTIIVEDSNTNDMGNTINMVDYELGKIRFDWDDISEIHFYSAPAVASSPYGSALYGTVKTERRKKFTGYIQWDMDERSGNDVLDGDTKYGDQKIPFEKISGIEKIRNGDAINLSFQSGRTIDLDGSNDCDDGNRGIGVFSPGIGCVEIEWEEFASVDFIEAPMSGISYDDFGNARTLEAQIMTYNDETYEGMIAFDLDELWDFELLDGDDDDVKLQIPFRNIESITPKNRNYSMITLMNGDNLLLGDRQDVSSRNDGIIMLSGNDAKVKIEWDDVDKIIFKK